ncbi:MAG: tRNA (N6-isopentenyl adenosine(37)-C2)-methylthiotransferase MiaB [Oscillospiraceae bacterium]|nr:tRNA (N6-isopentenyl adenosine(37)-C2)-methylthiotransferase MiaB [Oscillospiraceae bacterium]
MTDPQLAGLPETEACIRAVREWLSQRPEQPLAYLHSFGCQLNVADGEKLTGLLMAMGYGMTEEPEKASLILYNTCAVRENAEDRVFGTLGSIKHLKTQNPALILCVTGCMTAQESVAEKIRRSYPYVDIVIGSSAVQRLPQMLYAKMQGQRHAFDTETYTDIPEGIPTRRESSFKAAVPIMYGCNNFCTYCIVPYVRGRERSRTQAAILAEVRELVENGYREIMLLGQNVNSFSPPDGTDFPALLREIDKIPGDFRIRFMSSHPKDATPALMDAILECEHVAKHLHLPVQSGSNDVLRRMNRRYTVEKYLSQVEYIRTKCPDFSLTTDLIVGFPDESEADFEATLALVRRVRFDNMYSFIYSKRTGTKAALMDDPVTDAEKSARMTRLLALQREIAVENNRRFVGRTLRVLCDGVSRKRPECVTGRSSENMLVEFPGDASLIGSFADVTITESHSGALTGVLR